MRAELGQVGGDELRVQQHETAQPQTGNQVHQGDLGGIPRARKHAFTEKRARNWSSV